AQKWRDFIGDEAAGFLVTHHWVACVKRLGVDCLDAGDGIDYRAGDIRAALIARDTGVNLFKGAAALNSVDDARYISSREDRAAPVAITAVVGDSNSVHGPYLRADTVEREDGGRVTDMAKRYVRLDRQEINARNVTPGTKVLRIHRRVNISYTNSVSI